MSGLDDRLSAVRELRRIVVAQAAQLEETALAMLPFPRQVIRADIALAARRLAAFDGLSRALTGREAVGTVALALPGNAILSNPVSTIGSAYLAGNRVLVRFPQRRKHWADVIMELLREAFGSAIEVYDQPGPAFIEGTFADPEVGVLMVFGSDSWMLPYEEAARCTGTKLIFEGPGKDPFLVLAGADVPAAARAAAVSGTYNTGQACTAPERVYVEETLYDHFVEELVTAADALPVGDLADEATWVGPLAAADAARVREQVSQAVAAGARVLTSRAMESTTMVAPTVLVDVDHGMDVMRVETFGPVLPVFAVSSAERAVALAEDSPYGLSATVYGGPAWVPARLARSHGDVYLNETWLDRRTRLPVGPYGGRRRSGWVWEWHANQFMRRDGPRLSVTEFSLPSA
ncbi:MAG TPA: aldehyde dehydrogenase family protein [Jatrophihabitans sp.]|jgi:succinate-semialdehyde dehydrogenase/glutarate-semialdehyde dehydrogenase|uniref:aldehyde dehydrogenase family protein n=1 Tax=Jatrophihabitans sp. TaxID=1932789 RepID=UPI002EF3EEA3